MNIEHGGKLTMRYFGLALSALALGVSASSAHAAPGDILIHLRANNLRFEGSTAPAITVGNSVTSARPHDTLGGEGALSFFLTNHVAIEGSVALAQYSLRSTRSGTVAKAGLLLPSLILQYHPLGKGRLRPYIGAGATYLNYYSEAPGDVLTAQVGPTALPYGVTLEGGPAPTVQGGFDIDINDKLFLNADARYLWSKGTLEITQGAARQTIQRKTRALVIGGGVGFRF